LARNGDRLEYFQDPISYKAQKTEHTALGAVQSHQLGSFLRSVYLNTNSPSHIRGIKSELADTNQIYIRANAGGEGKVIFDSAIALLQGLYPPTPKNSITLANGTFVTAPLGGYQYVPIETVEPGNDRSLESWTDCPAFQNHVMKVMESDAFQKRKEAAKPFLNQIKGYVYGPKVEFDNMWNVHEYVHSELTHNRTYAFRLPPTMIEQSRHHVNYHQDAIFSDPEIGGIGNIAGRTMLRSILNSLSRIAYNGDPLQLFLQEVTYQPFISLFHMLEFTTDRPELKALPNFASAFAIELRRGDEDDSRDYLRFKFKNGTADGDFKVLHPFGHRTDIPLAEFIYRTQQYQVANNQQWRQACNAGSIEGAATLAAETISENMGWVLYGAFCFSLLVGLFAIVQIRKARLGRIRLATQEVEAGHKSLVRF